MIAFRTALVPLVLLAAIVTLPSSSEAATGIDRALGRNSSSSAGSEPALSVSDASTSRTGRSAGRSGEKNKCG